MCFHFLLVLIFLGCHSAIWRLFHWNMFNLSRTLTEAQQNVIGTWLYAGSPLHSHTRQLLTSLPAVLITQEPWVSAQVTPHLRLGEKGKSSEYFIFPPQKGGEEWDRKWGTNFKRGKIALPGWLSRLRHQSTHQKAEGLIPGQSTYLGYRFCPWLGHIWQATDWCFSLTYMFLSLSVSLPLCLKSIHIYSGDA